MKKKTVKGMYAAMDWPISFVLIDYPCGVFYGSTKMRFVTSQSSVSHVMKNGNGK